MPTRASWLMPDYEEVDDEEVDASYNDIGDDDEY